MVRGSADSLEASGLKEIDSPVQFIKGFCASHSAPPARKSSGRRETASRRPNRATTAALRMERDTARQVKMNKRMRRVVWRS